MTTHPELKNDLLPCPFCGGEAQTDYWDIGKTMYTVECRACFGMCYSLGDEKSAIKSWNTRPEKCCGARGAEACMKEDRTGAECPANILKRRKK